MCLFALCGCSIWRSGDEENVHYNVGAGHTGLKFQWIPAELDKIQSVGGPVGTT